MSKDQNGGSFRVTLHRTTEIAEREYFQQITPYRGSFGCERAGGKGRIFTIDGGLVGLCVRYGQPLIFRRDPATYSEMMVRTNFEALLARPISKDVNSILACPFFGKTEESGKEKVMFALFIDSDSKEFFHEQTLRYIYAACRGFIANIDATLGRTVWQISSRFEGHLVCNKLEDDLKLTLASVGVEFESEEFKAFRSDLVFSVLESTEIDVAPPHGIMLRNSP